MASGTMSAMGIGSDILSSSNLDQYKAMWEENEVKPITTKIETNLEKQTELTTLMTSMTTLNTSFKNLSDLSTYQKRTTTVEGTGVKATAGDGLAIQDIKINVAQLAQNDVNQVGMKFASRDSVFTNKNTTIDFYHNGTSYSIDVRAGSTVADVAQSITDATDGAVLGIIMKTGGDNPYQLMIQSKDSGKNNKIYFGSTLESAATPGGKITSGELKIDIAGKSISVDLSTIGSEFGNESKDNANLILEKINEEIAKDSDLQAKVDSGEITIGLNSTGKGLMLNDSTGGPINITVTDAKVQASAGTSITDTDLGFVKTKTDTKDLVTGGAVKNGQLSGKIFVNGTAIDLSSINSNNNAQEVANAINAQFSNGEVVAKVENGKLILNSNNGSDIVISAEGADETARNNVLSSVGLRAGTFSSSESFLKTMDITNIQKAQNAELTYNGIQIERDTNEINDIVTGLTLELTAITEKDKDVIVRVGRNDDGIADEVKSFVENYNAVYNKIQELVRYDEDTQIAGVFNGNSEVRSIIRQLNTIITANFALPKTTTNEDGKTTTTANNVNLMMYGISMNDDGTLKFDSEKFNEAYKDDPDTALAFFRSGTQTRNGVSVETDGVFTQLRDTMDRLITGSDSTLKTLEQGLKDEKERLDEEKTAAQESVDSKYDIMQTRWQLYDQMIAKIQQSANTVSQMIQMAMNG